MSTTVGEVSKTYDRAAPLYDLLNYIYFLGRDKQFRALLSEELHLKPDDIVLNICSGTGIDFPFLIPKIRNVGTLIGVDVSSEMIKQARKKIKSKEVIFVRSDAGHLPFKKETFDTVSVSFCLKVTPMYKETIDEVARILKPYGKIGVLSNHKPSGLLQLPGTIFTKILSIMAKIDFEIDLKEHFSKKFTLIKDHQLYGGLVQFLLGIKNVLL